jgi:uncharacterized membrane protein YhaH (DUF805 family)
MRELVHRMLVYTGLVEDDALTTAWEQSTPDRTVRIAVWAVPVVLLLVGAVAVAVAILATVSILQLVAAVFLALFVVSLLGPWVAVAVRGLRRLFSRA